MKNRYIYIVSQGVIEFYKLNYNQWKSWVSNCEKEGWKAFFSLDKIHKFKSVVNMLSDLNFKIKIEDINPENWENELMGDIIIDSRKVDDLNFIKQNIKNIAEQYNFDKFSQDFPDEVSLFVPREINFLPADSFYTIYQLLEITTEVIETNNYNKTW